MAVVAAKRGHDVRLWGTWLDDALLDAVDRGNVHPRLQLTLGGIRTLRSSRVAEALEGAELVVHAVNSDGAVAVMKHAARAIPDVPVLSVTKGLLENEAGRMDRVDLVLQEARGARLRFVHAAGPAKAMEIARGVLTWMVFAGEDSAFCAEALEGDALRVSRTNDIAGAELSSALKNAYATGLGLWDGFLGKDAHNARAACFTQAIVEMRRLVVGAGGCEETVNGAAGIGDLHVTAAGGRNRAFGERVGRGRPAREVAAEMLAAGELTEGYPAVATALRFAREWGVGELPLLEAIHAIVWEGVSVAEGLGRLELSTRR
jgi:glycerol-3-phosphate dehydrogenase (NAD(P)+)